VVVYQSVVRLLIMWYVSAIGILIRKMGKNVSRVESKRVAWRDVR
jgi:hypothetical protein